MNWAKWTQYVNQKYRPDWYNGKTGKNESKIDFNLVKEYLNGNQDHCSTAKVFIDDIQINSHFFDNEEIVDGIVPREFKSI